MDRNLLKRLLYAIKNGDRVEAVTCLKLEAAKQHKGSPDFSIWMHGIISDLERNPITQQKVLQILPKNNDVVPSLNCFNITTPIIKFSDLILPQPIADFWNVILKEPENSEKLEKHNIPLTKKILLSGPPGCGKTASSEALAESLGVPFYWLKLGNFLQSHLGDTIRNIEKSFAAMKSSEGVFLFDEVDAITSSRSERDDIGEMRRAVNCFLQEIEKFYGPGILLCATNRPQDLDHALFRRFQAHLKYESGGEEARISLLKKLEEKHNYPLNEKFNKLASEDISLAELSRDVENRIRLELLGIEY